MVVILFTKSESAFASHSMGADMTYQCLGNNTYRLRLSFYRDCYGIDAPTTVLVNIGSINCNIDTFAILMPVPGTGQEITPLCPSDSSTCNGGAFTGIQEYVYEGNFTFPAQCTDWQLTYELCCRNAAITTIANPDFEDIVIFSNLNNTICNNSPTFSNRPVPFVCQGQQFCFNHGAFDPDGDSLAYELITPIGYLGFPVTYYPGYSPYQPLNSVPAMTFDHQTGDFCITPQSLEVTVMAVVVSEYRNGVLIGQVERDIQITVIACNNNLPVLSGINGTNSFTATICADAPYCFNVLSNDIDAGQNVTLTWDQSIQNASFNITAGQHPNANFCWTPTQADAGGTPHCFTATVVDDACPFLGTQIYSYCLTVLNVHVNAGVDQFVNCGAQVSLNATGSTAYGNITYLWNTGATTQTLSAGAGSYSVVATNGTCTASDAVNVLPTSGPVASFNSTTVCEGMPVSFTDNSTIAMGSITSWNWNFGDGATSTSQSPSHLYATSGTYNVRLVVTSSANCSDTVNRIIQVNPVPVSSFTFSNVCLGSAISLTNTSTPPGLNSNWTLGNNTTSTAASPSVTYAAPGNYVVTLITTDPAGCADTVQQNVTVYSLPQATFSSAIPNPCPGDYVFFTDASQSNIQSWSWSFSNGQTSQLQNPDLVFSSGNYSAQLTVTDNHGCTSSTNNNFSVTPAFSAGISPQQSICPGSQATLTANGGISYSWSNGATGASITESPSSTTTYTVTATDANGCTATAQSAINVYSPPVINAGTDQNVCLGGSVTLSANGAVSYIWSNGSNTQNILVTPSLTSDYIVTGTDANGCSSSDSVKVIIHANLNVAVPDQLICPGASAILDAGFPGSNYTWSTGQHTQTISTSTAGNYSVVVTDANGCTGTAVTSVVLGGQGLVSNPTIVGTCETHYETIDAGNPGNHYLWSSGQTTQQISVVVAGNYTVTVTDNDGCSISYTSTLVVNPNPVVTYSHPTICAMDTIHFTGIASVSSGIIAHYLWYFGDGHSSLQQSPSHHYSAPGMYSLKLTVTTDSGCIANFTTIDTVYALPDANIQIPAVCLGNATLFNDQSSVMNDSLGSWSWTFGDGGSSNQHNPSHQYPSDGTYNVHLTVMSIHGCKDSVSSTATVHPLPPADAGSDTTICSGNSIIIGAPPVSGIGYQWAPTTNLSQWNLATAVFSGYNNTIVNNDYVYHLVTTNQYGCLNYDDVSVRVLPVPELNFSAPGPQCLDGNAFDFTASGYVDRNSTLFWDFTADATPSSSQVYSPSVVSYATPGVHPVVLYYSYGQCPGIPVIDTVTIWQNPQTGFLPTAYDGCLPLTVTFYNSHPNTLDHYNWSIDGNTFNDMSPSWTFNREGSFNVTLNVENEHGCKADPFTIPVTVYPLPTASFVNTPEYGKIYESLVEFRNYSKGAAQYSWDFGDGSSDNFFEGTHTYNDTGSFDIVLTVMSNHGCIDTVHGKVRIEDGFSFYVPNAFTPNEDGVNDSFQGYGTYLHTYEMWIYDRWGKTIYYTDKYDKPWDGRMHSIVQNDTYVYRIRVTDSKEKEHIYLGSVTLVK